MADERVGHRMETPPDRRSRIGQAATAAALSLPTMSGVLLGAKNPCQMT